MLVAPVIEQGATKRDIVLPEGTWIDGNNGSVYEGKQVLKNYPAAIDVLPYFLREGSEAAGTSETTKFIANFVFIYAVLIKIMFDLIH